MQRKDTYVRSEGHQETLRRTFEETVEWTWGRPRRGQVFQVVEVITPTKEDQQRYGGSSQTRTVYRPLTHLATEVVLETRKWTGRKWVIQ